MTNIINIEIMKDIYSADTDHYYNENILRQQWDESNAKIAAELTGYMEIIKDFDKDSAQDATALHAYLIHLTQIMARANFLMAEYQKKFREEKLKAYKDLTASVIKDQKYYAPSLAKDFIDSQCSETGFIYDLAERTSRLCDHTEKAVITIISSLKSERQFAQYS